MNEARVENRTRWYVIHTHSKQEDRVVSNLKVLGPPTFSPRVKEKRYHPYGSGPIYQVKPLFPRYVFARFDLAELYHKIRFTRGVFNIVSFGDGPTSIDEEAIAMIQSKTDKDGFVRIEPGLMVGDRVIVKDGPLRNFAGVFEKELKDVDRIRILLETVSYQAHIEIERSLVMKAG